VSTSASGELIGATTELSPRRKTHKQAVLKQLLDEFFKRKDKPEKKDKEEKRQMKEQLKEEKRLRLEEKKEEKRERKESRTKDEKEKEEKKSPRKVSAEVAGSAETDGKDDSLREEKNAHKKHFHLGMTEKEKRNTRRSMAVGNTMCPDF